MEQLYEKYLNIQLFANIYREFSLIEGKYYNYEEFKHEMQIAEYIVHNFIDTKGTKIDIYLFKIESRHISNTVNFNKILDKYDSKNPIKIIMITKDELNSYRRKSINQHNLKVNNYLHKDFNIEKSKGSLCSKHVILTEEEAQVALYSNMIEKESLPKISELDPQIIWIGGQPGDIIKITPYSEITGFSVVYRLVIPSYGNIIQSPEYNLNTKKITTIKEDDDDVEDVEEEIDEVNVEEEFVPEDEEFVDDGGNDDE
jgi:DNA-directed RNA polymerase subunit H (RpoH/RPB5)